MSITTKIKLFNTYIKPLIAYGCELMDLSTTEINELKKTEGNALKRIIGITKKCHTGPVYGACYMEATDKSILKQQMKFVLRLQTNDYLNKFLINSRIIENNSGMLGRVITILKLKPDCSLVYNNNQIETTLNEMDHFKN